MTTKEGWITFFVAVGAGVVVYLLDSYVVPSRPVSAPSLPTVVTPSGVAAAPQNSIAATRNIYISDESDVDTGSQPQTTVQTEAAYNVGSTGTAGGITYGPTPEDSDYAQYSDPNEVLV